MIARNRHARQQLIDDILRRQPVRSQNELLELLASEGVEITQPTLSRDLMELRAVKVRSGNSLVYALPGLGGDTAAKGPSEPCAVSQRLRQVCEELVVSAVSTGSMVVVRTPPGAANYLAAAIDQSTELSILGTIAGDDTVLLITDQADDLTETLLALSDPARRRGDTFA